ncbi:CCR4-NOT transcription complex subunit 7-like [Haemaphysalis longicornis]
MPSQCTAGASPNANHWAHAAGSRKTLLVCNEACSVRDTWAANIDEGFCNSIRVAQKHNFGAMGTEFLVPVDHPTGVLHFPHHCHYQLLRCNLDRVEIIQLGLAFLDEAGNPPRNYSTCSSTSCSATRRPRSLGHQLLTNSGNQFKEHERESMNPYENAQILVTTRVALSDSYTQLSFSGGPDIAFVLKLLAARTCPRRSQSLEVIWVNLREICNVNCPINSGDNPERSRQEAAEQ